MAGVSGAALTAALQEAMDLMQAGRVAEATEKLEALAADRPRCPYVLRALGYCHHQAGRQVDAARMLERAMEEEPTAELAKNAFYFRSQIALKILDGVPPNGDGLKSRLGADPD